jgi:DNA-binding XRE family transcriptional regulator
MTPSAYQRLRKLVGSVKQVARRLGVTERTIYYRETEGKITKEAELALKYVVKEKLSRTTTTEKQ